MKTFFTLMALSFLGHVAQAQLPGLYTAQQSWTEAPVLHSLPNNFKEQSAVYLQDTRIFQYKVDDKDLFQYVTYYKLVKVSDDKGIEMFNRVYLYVPPYAEISDIKARAITSTGKVLNIPADKIKEEMDEGNRYKLFAMEGLDKGAEIEYSYTIKRKPVFFGSETYQTKNVPTVQARLLIITPAHLRFSAKGYNGFIMLKDSLIGEERFMPGYASDIKEMDDEKYGLRTPALQRADFKFSYNLAKNNDVELYTWKELARNVYSNITTLTDKEKKARDKFMAGINIPAGTAEESVIQLLEDYLKKNINIDEKISGDEVANLEKIIKTGNTNDFGAVRLLCAMLEEKNIKYQVVFPSVRDELPLDEEMANWNRIDETLLYFPSTGKFLQPNAVTIRYPFTSPYCAGTKGLFVKGTTIGDIRTAVGRFDDISIFGPDANAHNLELDVRMDDNGDSLIIKSKQILKGYGAISYRPIWSYLEKDKQTETVKSIIQSVARSENIQDIKCENTGFIDFWDNKPLIIGGTIHTGEPIERAGNKILLKLGELIGRQEEMYQEKPRQLPADVGYAHILERKINFEIPAGYNIKNPEALNMDIQVKKEGKTSMGFVSNYTLENNQLKLYILESYNELTYPLYEFENFKRVINAAADFNKIVLVLERKS